MPPEAKAQIDLLTFYVWEDHSKNNYRTDLPSVKEVQAISIEEAIKQVASESYYRQDVTYRAVAANDTFVADTEIRVSAEIKV